MVFRARLLVAAFLALFITAAAMPAQAFAAVQRSTYIVQTTAAGQDSVLKALFGMGEVPLDQLDFVMDGFTVPLTDFEATVLGSNPNVVSIQQDQKMSLLDTQSPVPSWGLDRIDQQTNTLDNSFSYPTDGGKGVRVYVVDTGVMATNPEFDGRILTGFDALGQNLQGADCHGHGTHVAGTIAGTKYGVAKAATIVPVRVLDCNGSGFTSNILTALDWILANNPAGTPAVMSMSIGGPLQPLFNAGIKKLYDGGILPIVAAGNSNDDACKYSPSSTPDALTVGASDSSDTRASFSNFGDCVDIFAPGLNIVSAKASDPAGSTTMSGTSMATPHVSGVAALYLAQHPTAKPAEVAQAVRDGGIKNALNNAQSQFGNILLNDNFVRGAAPVVPNPNPVLNAPDRVASLSFSAVTSNSVTVNWVDGASDGGSPIKGHVILAKAPGDLYYTSWNAIGQSLTSYVVTGISANTSYSFLIYPYNAIGSGPKSSPVSVVTPVGAPTAPSKPVVVAGASTASVTWSPLNDGGSPITGYTVEVYSATAPRWTAVASTSNTSATLTGLVSGVSYLVRVKATNALGTSYPSLSVSFTTVAGVPDVPTGINVSNITPTTALLSWNPVSSTSPTAPVTYVISYGIEGGSISYKAASTASSLQLALLAPGRKYNFTVHSQVGDVSSPESATNSFTTLATVPGAPNNVTLSGPAGAQILTWQSPAENGGSPLLGYIVQASEPLASTTAPVTNWSTFAQQSGTSIAVPAAPIGKYVRYRVIAKNALGLGEPSLSVAAFSAPAKASAPTNLAVSAPNANGSITLTWSAPVSDGGSPITQYSVVYSRDGVSWLTLANLPPSQLNLVIGKPTKGQTWSFAVYAKTIAGSGPNSNVVTASTAATVPGVVTGQIASLTGTSDVTARWSAPLDNGGVAITGYTVERQVSGVWSTVAQLPANVLTYTAARAGIGQLNTFRITALNSLGAGLASPAFSVMTPYLQASAPQNFTASYNATTKRVDVAFAAPSSLGGGSVQTYSVQTSRDGGLTWSVIASLVATSVSGSVPAPAKNQTLAYRIVAITQFGSSQPSSTVNISVAPTVPGLVTSPYATLTGTSDVTVRWAAPSDTGGLAITGYTVERLVGGVWSVAASVPAGTLSYTAARALPGTLNSFKVSATNSLGVGVGAAPFGILTPYLQASAPQNFTALYNATTKRVVFTYSAPSDLGGGSVATYRLQTSNDGGVTWFNYLLLSSNSTTFSLLPPLSGTAVSYRLLANTQFGLSLPSAVATVTAP